MPEEPRVVITGVGPLTAVGSGKEKVWQAIAEGRTGLVYKEYKSQNEVIGRFYVHEIENFDIMGYDINKNILDEVIDWKMGGVPEDFYYFLATIRMAIDDAVLKINDAGKYETGLVLAHENFGLDDFYQKVIDELSFFGEDAASRPMTKKGFLDAFYNKFHRAGYELQTFMALHHVAKIFDVHGYSLILNNACASGLYALQAAADIIKSGRCKRMIVAAVDHASIFKQLWFRDMGVLAKDGKTKPFADKRDGFAIGDGGAAMVMESAESAKERNADVYAEYVGGSFALEAWKVVYPDVSNNLYKKMMLNALKEAGLEAADIDLVVPHGVGTNITDKYEAKAIREVFDEKDKSPVITALKPYIGHTLGSTALLETAIMLIGIKNGKIPPTLNCEEPDKTLGIDVLRKPTDAKDIKLAMKTACGFAGYDGACVFKTP